MILLNLAISILFIVLAGDLLYLYYIGSWYDPIKVIEYTEVIFLYLFIVLGIVGFILNFRRGW